MVAQGPETAHVCAAGVEDEETMGKAALTDQDHAYLQARKSAGTYKNGDADRRKGVCTQCRKEFFERVGEMRDAARGLTALQCHYCKEMAERYASVAAERTAKDTSTLFVES